jgi:hypothetical protein
LFFDVAGLGIRRLRRNDFDYVNFFANNFSGRFVSNSLVSFTLTATNEQQRD